MSKQETSNGSGLSRRDFLKTAAAGAVGAAAVGALGACTTTPAEAGTVGQAAGWSWDLPEKPITSFADTRTFDVVVVGCGLAGMCAAVSAAEHGAKVAVIEKTGAYNVRGMHIAGVDTSAQRAAGITINKYKAARDLVRWSGKRIKEELLWLFLNHSGAAIDWCFDICKENYPQMYLTMWDACYRGEDYYENPGATHIFSGGPGAQNFNFNGDIADSLIKKAAALGVEFFYNMPGKQLIKEGGKVTGIAAGTEGSYSRFNGNIVLATGDYGGNDEMIERYLPWVKRVHQKIYSPAGMNTGDGHIMGLRAGASMQAGQHGAMIHPQVGGPVYCFLRVNKNAQRYENEDISAIGCSTSIMMQPDQQAWCLFDANWIDYVIASLPYGGGLMWDQVFREWGAPFNREMEQMTIDWGIQSGSIKKADTVAGLAEQMGVDAATLQATMDRFNKIVADKNDLDFGKRPELLFPITEPPFYASQMMTGLLAIPAGLSVNEKMQVIAADYVTPIEGLYAVGNAGGDFFAQDYPTIFPGHSHGRCITFGRIGGAYAAGMQSIEAL
ncbi:MAG: FAD-binding protein [Treponema sp.]|jgi:succinate dehydrogenase/fumarate reductase flavoprotein subunit|nr:FAD-binding protein [Treponema sp.]